MIAILTCGKSKQRVPAKAIDIYIGNIFQKKLAYVKAFYPNVDIYILSAKYGIIPADLVIEPYDKMVPLREDDFFREWSQMVTEQLQSFDKTEDIVFLGNQHYYNPIDSYFVGQKQAPLLGLKPGQQLARLTDELNDLQNKKQRKLF